MKSAPEDRPWNEPFIEAEMSGDVGKALSILEGAAKGGDSDAAFLLGQECGVYARPGLQDFEQSFRWFKLASDLGDAASTYEQGIALLNGLGVAPSLDGGVAKIKQAAKAGNEMALEFLLKEERAVEYSFSITNEERSCYESQLEALLRKT